MGWKILDEPDQLLFVQESVRPQTRADIDPEWPHLADSLANVVGCQPSGEPNRDFHLVSDSPADRPIVSSSRASQLLDRLRRVAGVEEQGVGRPGRPSGLIDSFVTDDVDDLDDRDPGHQQTELGDVFWRQIVAELNGVHPEPSLLTNDCVDLAAAGEEKGGYAGRNLGGDFLDAVVRDDTRTAGHFRDQAKGVRAVVDGEDRLFNGGNAAHLQARPDNCGGCGDHQVLSKPLNSGVDVGHGGGHFGDQSFVTAIHTEDFRLDDREPSAGLQNLGPTDESIAPGRSQEIDFELY